jgi:sugar transferase EpsL
VIKFFLDLVLSLLGLLILAPLFIIISLLLLSNGRPIIFKQIRPGLNGVHFNFYKFRTMNEKKDEKGQMLSDQKRITNLGKILRKLSLDELPSLYNVLKGDMSLVGPRPLLVEYLPLYSNEHSRRHEVKPGITGWAQINGRNTISWHEKFELDLWYIQNQSFFLDIKILFLTISKVFLQEGINKSKDITMEKFNGYN